ncbi:MAG TPA: Hpt domain-containing protein [Candidatus Limnocylindrales bacterium]|nr:Hpt domain-containing protein [Candidatus Limnocylindrales bacterium]
MTDPIDEAAFAQTLDLVGGDREFLAELVETYGTDGQARIADMRSALAAGAAPELQRAAHTLKGSSATLGASHLAELCRSVEYAARDGDIGGLAERIDDIATEFDAVVAALTSRARGGG